MDSQVYLIRFTYEGVREEFWSMRHKPIPGSFDGIGAWFKAQGHVLCLEFCSQSHTVLAHKSTNFYCN